jgi:hypothetical protein
MPGLIEDCLEFTQEPLLRDLRRHFRAARGKKPLACGDDDAHATDRLARRVVEKTWPLIDAMETLYRFHKRGRLCDRALMTRLMIFLLDVYQLYLSGTLADWPAHAERFAQLDNRCGDLQNAADWLAVAERLRREEADRAKAEQADVPPPFVIDERPDVGGN